MANDCYNYLTISESHAEEVLSNVLNEDGVVDLNILVPMPDDVTILVNPVNNENYKGERDWGWDAIGTPGLARDTEIEELEDGSMYVTFTSEWTPPDEWFNTLSQTSVPLDIIPDKPLRIELEYASYDEEFAGRLDYIKEPIDGRYSTVVKYEGDALVDALGLPELTKFL